jgi:hypothetical protein
MSDFDTGQEQSGLEAAREEIGQNHDQDQELAAFAETEHYEHHEHYVHVTTKEYDDGHGGHFTETEYEYYDETESETRTVGAFETDSGFGDASEQGESFTGIHALEAAFDELFGKPEPIEQGLGAADGISPDVSN